MWIEVYGLVSLSKDEKRSVWAGKKIKVWSEFFLLCIKGEFNAVTGKRGIS